MANITYDDAAHLLRRMGFGGSPSDIEDLTTKSREAAVDFLIEYSQVDDSATESLLASSFDFSDPFDFPKFNRSEIQRWWFTRMVYTKRPFQEKMTLFWHNHFATAASKVDDIFMYIQNKTLRANALARFDDLLLAVARDPAMLIWLDGITSVQGHPNENFGRELQELFTQGISDVVTGTQNYTEDDVKEIARAFTGWKFFHPRNDPNPFNYQFVVFAPDHDNGLKTVYGQTANFGGEDVVTVVAAKQATGRYLVKKLFEFFVYPLNTSASDKSTIDKFATIYAQQDHSIKKLVRAIFISDEFFSARARFALIKSPVELLVGAVRMLNARYNPGNYVNGSNILAQIAVFLGQELLNPPDVAGWRLNLGWINTSTLLNRFTFADLLAISRTADLNAPGLWISHDQLRSIAKKKSKKTVKNLLQIMGPLQVDSQTRNNLIAYLETDDNGNHVPFSRDDQTIDKKMRGLLHLVMCLSEFQLN